MSTTVLEKCEVMDDCGMNPRPVTQDTGALSRLLRPDEDAQDVLHMLLPNRVVIKEFEDEQAVRRCAMIPTALWWSNPKLELRFSEETTLQGVGASWYGFKSEEEAADV